MVLPSYVAHRSGLSIRAATITTMARYTVSAWTATTGLVRLILLKMLAPSTSAPVASTRKVPTIVATALPSAVVGILSTFSVQATMFAPMATSAIVPQMAIGGQILTNLVHLPIIYLLSPLSSISRKTLTVETVLPSAV